ncbi:MAG: putative inorganic polyphosphate/ATP-NAD kinase [Chloroflexi bacterium]|nr:putative inorganic polyphosphate/ATP-NAD kinase [Chloroflexota bacterium]
MSDVVLVYQPMVEGALGLAKRCAAYLEERAYRATLISAWNLETADPPVDARLVATFGGDGTILRTARWLAECDVPILGIQMGRLGFLAELMPSDLPSGLDPYLGGGYWVDRRAMLRADPGSFLALNDIVVGRGQSLRTVTVELSTDGHPLHRFRCDGLIVATATGSTAYSFAAGGPILAPDSTELVVTAICPHISAVRSLVVPGDIPLRLQVWTSQPAVMTVDGVDGQIDKTLWNSGVVEARLSERTTTFARRGSRAEFYSRILAKLD